jgi:hypothetical protein
MNGPSLDKKLPNLTPGTVPRATGLVSAGVDAWLLQIFGVLGSGGEQGVGNYLLVLKRERRRPRPVSAVQPALEEFTIAVSVRAYEAPTRRAPRVESEPERELTCLLPVASPKVR